MTTKIHNIDSDCFCIAIDNTSKAATLKTTHPAGSVIKGFNDSDKAVFITSGKTQPTAVFPTSASVSVKGQVIGPKMPFEYQLPHGDLFISAIQGASGTGSLYFSVG